MKAILVIDMPKNCDWCLFNNKITCVAGAGDVRMNIVYGNKSPMCPLKEMPIKKMTESLVYANGEVYMRQNCFTEYDKGWNACIDEILGGNDDNSL